MGDENSAESARPGESHPPRTYSLALPTLRQENFESFVLAESTVQLAYPESCAYTDFAADSQRSSRVMQCDPDGTYAAERACLRRQPGLTQVICSESCILLPASFLLAHFWRNISGPTVPLW